MRISENYLLKKVAGEYIVAPLTEAVVDINNMVTVNETGGFIWKQIEQGADTIEKIVAELCKEYDITADDCIEDVKEFVEDMKNKGIIIDD